MNIVQGSTYSTTFRAEKHIENIAKVSKAHIPPAEAIRGHTTSRQKTDYRKRYTSSHQMVSQAVPEKGLGHLTPDFGLRFC